MIVILILCGLGFWLGVNIQSRLGAAFLCLSAATSVQAILNATPHLLGGSTYGRRLAALLSHVGDDQTYPLIQMFGIALAGLALAILLHSISEDRKFNRSRPSRRRRKAMGPRHDPC